MKYPPSPRLLVALLVTLAAPALAAPPRDPGRGPGDRRAPGAASASRPEGPERRARLLRERVGLDDAKARRVEAILDRHRAERERTRDRVATARRRVAELVRADGKDEAPYRAAVEELRASHDAAHSARTRMVDEVARELTPREQARLLVAMAELRGPGRDGHGRGHGHGPRGSGPDDDAED